MRKVVYTFRKAHDVGQTDVQDLGGIERVENGSSWNRIDMHEKLETQSETATQY